MMLAGTKLANVKRALRREYARRRMSPDKAHEHSRELISHHTLAGLSISEMVDRKLMPVSSYRKDRVMVFRTLMRMGG